MPAAETGLLSSILHVSRKIARFINVRVRGMFRRNTAQEKEFINVNQNFWKANKNTRQVPSDQFIFVHYELYPLALLGNLHIASIIASLRDARLLLIVPSCLDKATHAVLKSFPNVSLVYEDSPRFLLYRILSYFQAFKALRSIKTPEQLLSFSCDGVLFGDTIYDAVLSRGFATINKVNRRQILPVMARYFYHRAATRWVLSKHRVINGFSTHIVGVSGAVFLRYLLKSGIDVFIRETMLKKYTSLGMAHECGATPDKRYIEFMLSHAKIYIPLGEHAINTRLGRMTQGIISHLPYKTGKRIYTSREQFAQDYGLDVSKKNAFVMMHAFNDYPHTYGDMFHRDFYCWFTHVLSLAQTIQGVNWIFKDHPYARYYPTDVDIPAMFDKISSPNIRFFDEDANFNTASLEHLADVVLTSFGTAGLEYSTFGIPCILAAKCFYSGLGFTREPRTIDEYEQELRNIHALPRLSNEQIAIAKIMAFFSFQVMNHPKFPDPFRTIATYDIDEANTFTSDQLIGMILKHRAASSNDEKNTYMKAITDFILDSAWIQYVDFAEYPELRMALSHEYRP